VSTSSKPESLAVSPWAMMTLELIDGAIQGCVLVYGSLPPEGGDIDLLARPAELSAIRETLIAAGFMPVGRMLVRFQQSRRELVELTPADAWGLPPDELDALFSESQPINGVQWLMQPSIHHTLLIRARKAVRRRASLQKLRSLKVAWPYDESEIWHRAIERASAWHVQRALRVLRLAYELDGRVPRLLWWSALLERLGSHEAHGVRGRLRILRDFLPLARPLRLRRTYVIAFSGLDGSGKSSQARRLRDALRATGQDSVVIWAGIGTNQSLNKIKEPVKRCLRTLPRVGPFKEVIDQVTPKPDGRRSPLAEPGKRSRRHSVGFNIVTWVWMAVMALANVYSLRKVLLQSFGRGRVVIFDRYTLDSAVRLCHWYGDSRVFRLVIRVVHLLAKRPVKAYFLEVPPHEAFARKPEWELDDLICRAALYHGQYAWLGIRRLDGMRPLDDLSNEIAAEVWAAVH
jgi:thymidylate kinase